MSLFNFSLEGESSSSGKLESKARKFDLELNTEVPVKSMHRTVCSVAFFHRIEAFADMLNSNLYMLAATDRISIQGIRIVITGNITESVSKQKGRQIGCVSVTVAIRSDADTGVLNGLLAKARQKTYILKNMKHTKFNYSLNTTVHLN